LNEWEIDLGEQITSKLLRRLFYSGMHAQSFHRFMRLGRRTHWDVQAANPNTQIVLKARDIDVAAFALVLEND